MSEKDTNKIIKLGNYMPSNYESSQVVHIKGISPTFKENHGTVAAILVYEEDDDNQEDE